MTQESKKTFYKMVFNCDGATFKSTELLFKMLNEGFNLEMFLEKLSECLALSSDIILRVSEKKFLNEYSKNLRFKSKDKIKNSSMKINCLLQVNVINSFQMYL